MNDVAIIISFCLWVNSSHANKTTTLHTLSRPPPSIRMHHHQLSAAAAIIIVSGQPTCHHHYLRCCCHNFLLLPLGSTHQREIETTTSPHIIPPATATTIGINKPKVESVTIVQFVSSFKQFTSANCIYDHNPAVAKGSKCP